MNARNFLKKLGEMRQYVDHNFTNFELCSLNGSHIIKSGTHEITSKMNFIWGFSLI